jgi:hypothetical protein
MPIGAINSGELVLGWHGFLENVEASTIPNRLLTAPPIKYKKWVDDPKVVVDHGVITAWEFKQARELVEAVVKLIAEAHPEK